VELYVHTIVRADALLLYGFGSLEERRTFETLLATPGVGPSTALAALRTLGLSALTSAIESGDVKAVASVPGIGPKTASRIVLELKGKLVFVSPDRAARSVSSGRGDIEDALRALGYSTGEIRDGLRDVELPTDESQALKVALQLVRRS
jgi:Holliday junction DNA helicase RuvA